MHYILYDLTTLLVASSTTKHNNITFQITRTCSYDPYDLSCYAHFVIIFVLYSNKSEI